VEVTEEPAEVTEEPAEVTEEQAEVTEEQAEEQEQVEVMVVGEVLGRAFCYLHRQSRLKTGQCVMECFN
jgi:hypothetical protein